MTITLHVDAEIERLARHLSDVTGRSVPSLIRSALESEARKHQVEVSDFQPTVRRNRDLDLDYFDDGPAQ